MTNRWKIKMILFAIASVLILTVIVMWLWNWLIPELFNGPVINFYQALGIMLLSRILCRGFHGCKGHGMQQSYWGKWKDNIDKMSPEQREKMRDLWKKRCSGFTCDDDKKVE